MQDSASSLFRMQQGHVPLADSNNEETQSRDLWERGASFLIGMITAESRNDVNRRCTDKGVWRKNQRSKEEMVDMLKTLIQNHVAQLREKHQHDNPHSCKRLPEIASEIWISLPCQSTAWSQDVHATNAGLEVFADAVSREMQIILQMKQHVHLYGGLPMGRHCALRKRWKRYQIELAHAHPSETVIARRRMWEQIPGWSWACRTLERIHSLNFCWQGLVWSNLVKKACCKCTNNLPIVRARLHAYRSIISTLC